MRWVAAIQADLTCDNLAGLANRSSRYCNPNIPFESISPAIISHLQLAWTRVAFLGHPALRQPWCPSWI